MADLGISLNFVSKKEHVPAIEWFNRIDKEHVRSDWAAILFKRIYKSTIIHFVATDIFCLNNFPLLNLA